MSKKDALVCRKKAEQNHLVGARPKNNSTQLRWEGGESQQGRGGQRTKEERFLPVNSEKHSPDERGLGDSKESAGTIWDKRFPRNA